MKKSIVFWGKALLSCLVLSVLLTGLLSGWQSIQFSKKTDWERLLPKLLAEQISASAPEEVLKAQAVLARSNLYLQRKNAQIPAVKRQKRDLRVFEKAVKATKGEVLSAEGMVCIGAYHRCNNGSTRSGAEVFADAEHAWLEPVESPWDLQAQEYLVSVVLPKKELVQKLQALTGRKNIHEKTISEAIKIEETDSRDYVTKLRISSALVSGEKFREALGLPSACFSIQDAGEQLRFLCRGSGHGFGMSQYGAAQLAKDGKNYREILSYYFPECEINCIES